MREVPSSGIYPPRANTLLHLRQSNEEKNKQIKAVPQKLGPNHQLYSNQTLTIGIASMSRKVNITQNYLLLTLNTLFKYLKQNRNPYVRIVVALTDESSTIVQSRAHELHKHFALQIEQGVLSVIAPNDNIYPDFNNIKLKLMGQRLPYGNSLRRSNWQAKLSLDFAFLFSYCSQLPSKYFLNLEDDVIPTKPNFLHDMMSYVEEQNEKHPYWNSLIFSNWLSIGRLYHTRKLKKLVDLILIAYDKQPVDFIMHHFEVLQMADRFHEFRRKPPLFEHIGDVSTMEEPNESYVKQEKVDKKLNDLKATNPPGAVSTNISQWQDNNINNSYYPSNKTSAYFWGRKYMSGDVIDVVLNYASTIRSILMTTGFAKNEERAGQDRLLEGSIQVAKQQQLTKADTATTSAGGATTICDKFVDVKGQTMNGNIGTIQFKSVRKKKSRGSLAKIKCIRFVIYKGQSDWLLVKLIHISVI